MTDVAALMAAVQVRRRELDRMAGRAQQLAKDGFATEAAIVWLTEQVELYAKTGALLTTLGEDAQESARVRFEELATRALQAVFAENLSFRLLVREVGGQAVLEPVIRSEHGPGVVTETPVMDARGGGMAVVVGFVLRLVMLMLTPGAQQILFLDESFGMVSESYVTRVAEFIREVTDRTGVQVVMITHDPVYAQYADVRYRLVLGADGVTQVLEGEAE